MARVGDILERLAALMPLDTAEDYDNVGLLAGSAKCEVTGVLCALDLNTYVIDEALSCGADLIVTHHPILFRGRKTLREDDPEGKMLAKLVRSGISLIAMHTNYDNADEGVNDALAARIGLTGVEKLESGMRIGEVAPVLLEELKTHVEKKLGGVVRAYGDPQTQVKRVAVLGGAGGDYFAIALKARADVFITGEVSYHTALDAVGLGMCVLEAGHAATEYPSVEYMARKLKNMGLDIEVFVSKYRPFL